MTYVEKSDIIDQWTGLLLTILEGEHGFHDNDWYMQYSPRSETQYINIYNKHVSEWVKVRVSFHANDNADVCILLWEDYSHNELIDDLNEVIEAVTSLKQKINLSAYCVSKYNRLPLLKQNINPLPCQPTAR